MNNQTSEKHILIIESPYSRSAVSLKPCNHTLGRHPENSIIINSQLVSRFHATLIWLQNSINNSFSFWIIDGNLNGKTSLNGVFVNGEKIRAHQLQDGNVIQICSEVKLRYQIIPSSLPTQDFTEELQNQKELAHSNPSDYEQSTLADEQNVHMEVKK